MTAETAAAEKVDFRAAASAAVADAPRRENFQRVMTTLMDKRLAQFPNPDELSALREQAAEVRARALSKLPDLLRRMEDKCRENGIVVHWAETPAEANRIILDILQAHGAKKVIKGKSMVSEETHLNAALEGAAIEVVESDLGEYIIQLAHETPSHIVMPCIHKTKEDIARLFAKHIEGQEYTEDVAALTEAARVELRERFAAADAGISGVNFMVAETGSLVLVENEGNGRLSTTLPPLHIAITGIEKVVENLDDVAPLLSLLPRSATGQAITTYVNMITSPRKTDEKDGPREVHLVLLDNGRSRVYADPQLRDTLRCIRCGACINHCPIYARVGGHAYQQVYPGPIGKILTPQLLGLESKGDQPHASSLCGRCVEVCPVKIPITDILVRLREEAVEAHPHAAVAGSGSRRSWLESVVWRGWKFAHAVPAFYRLAGWGLTRFGNLAPASMPMFKEWTSVRSKPTFAAKTLHELAKEKGFGDE